MEAIYDKKYKNEIAKNWKIIVRIYNSSKTMEPDDIAKKIVETLGYEQTVETFSVIVSIKIHDDRIYEDNRNWINSVYFASKAYDSGATTWSRENPVIYAGLDDIHTEYINQILTALRKMENKHCSYKTACPELVLACPGYFGGGGIGTIYIPIKYCPECGRKLGKDENCDE